MSTTAALEPTTEQSQYINETVLSSWRDFSARLQEAQKPIEIEHWNSVCDRLGLPHGTKYDAVPEDKREQWRELYRELDSKPEYRRPSGFERQPIPPKLPDSLQVFLVVGGSEDNRTWEHVSHEESAKLEVPADPIRVNHDRYFAEVFAAVREALNVDITPTETENQYYRKGSRNEPWFTFQIGDVKFVVGPRKRVVTIKVEAPKGIVTDSLRQVAETDATTYFADGDWQSDKSYARELEVHAWTKEKTIEYLTILGQSAARMAA